MNARIRPLDKVSKKKRQEIRDAVEQELDNQGRDIMRRALKLVAIGLNRDYGFGKVRIGRVIDFVSSMDDDRKRDEVFWTHIDRECARIGLEFEEENYEEMDG